MLLMTGFNWSFPEYFSCTRNSTWYFVQMRYFYLKVFSLITNIPEVNNITQKDSRSVPQKSVIPLEKWYLIWNYVVLLLLVSNCKYYSQLTKIYNEKGTKRGVSCSISFFMKSTPLLCGFCEIISQSFSFHGISFLAFRFLRWRHCSSSISFFGSSCHQTQIKPQWERGKKKKRKKRRTDLHVDFGILTGFLQEKQSGPAVGTQKLLTALLWSLGTLHLYKPHSQME